jgi:hypothetical protein
MQIVGKSRDFHINYIGLDKSEVKTLRYETLEKEKG